MVHVIDGPNSDFALRLVEARRTAELTQNELAELVGVDKRTISQYENGRLHPRAATLQRLAEHLKIEVGLLLTGMPDETRRFLKEHNRAAGSQCLIQAQALFIEPWEHVAYDSMASRPPYNERKSNPNDYVSVLKGFTRRLRATRFPGVFPDNVAHPSGAILIFDAERSEAEDVKNGDLVIFQLIGLENEAGLRRFVREPGTSSAFLHPISPEVGPVLRYDPLEYRILGVVVSQIVSL
ncbi:TPA: helix-turn-helix domain-containing protein [Pseudomonas aeruginosa]|uniref:LexA family transcriptional regulator n=1 Tax=Pseudomonas aeruginosa TaxID=287 RepID=UPI00188916CF|nr:LexA family transcriptional regulator [Pseudomonas aeruginosa]MBF1867494.1 helix-turn-helix domain-containing protein [Pseudomonas aeruginosa]MBG4901309.1 helix-turn-helix domain-containing protein [Pseudomonas aeruginosa]MBG6271149.1 helix-turn-helix domain-containing protein [Pseudomonas aeruginosa]HBP5443753.1 XRE family transcriptional regulator [Pseudomonas aeruginosa]HCF3391964.1 helix-turn-helix domain-containing protein [Pseudomonas aeruginosa]